MSSQTRYDLKSVKLPRLAGSALNVFVKALESPATRGFLLPGLLRDGGITRLGTLEINDPPTPQPFAPVSPQPLGAPPDLNQILASTPPCKGFAFASVRDYGDAFRSGRTTPEQVAQRVLDAIADSEKQNPAMRTFIAINRDDVMAQARASTQRFRENQPLGIFDGVPVAVKDEIAMTPYPTTVGTRFMGKTPARQDATMVARMRAAGALLLGKTNMHEIGIGITGLNPHHGAARNPYNPTHFTGGSSSGSAAAVAAGFCPVALGADAGGSIRIPSAFCGVVGLMPTYARVSAFGTAPLSWTLDHYGAITDTATDAALAYAMLAGTDPRDPWTLAQPAITLDGFDQLDLHGITLGVYTPWFEHASAPMVAQCKQTIKGLENLGARVIEIEIPELEAARIAHLVTVASEMATAMNQHYGAHPDDFGLDVRTNLALAGAFTARDYVQAQRVRTRTIANIERALAQVDAIVTPTTGITAPAIPLDALPNGESDLTTLTEIMRFVTLANLTGHPAISFPAGYDEQGMPVGFQAIGRYWHEHTLLRLAHAAEQVVERQAPQVHYQIL